MYLISFFSFIIHLTEFVYFCIPASNSNFLELPFNVGSGFHTFLLIYKKLKYNIPEKWILCYMRRKFIKASLTSSSLVHTHIEQHIEVSHAGATEFTEGDGRRSDFKDGGGKKTQVFFRRIRPSRWLRARILILLLRDSGGG